WLGADTTLPIRSQALREWACRLGALPPMRMTASWFGSAWNPPNTSVWRDILRPMASSPRIITQEPWFTPRHNRQESTAGGYVDDRRCRPVALPPASRASSKSGEMLVLAHIPTGPTNNEY